MGIYEQKTFSARFNYKWGLCLFFFILVFAHTEQPLCKFALLEIIDVESP